MWVFQTMASLQTPTSPRKTIPDFQISSKKRFWEDKESQDNFELFQKRSRQATIEKTKSLYGIEFQLEKPLPVDWQQCLDIQSGEIHFFNTNTHKKTCKDPRRSPERLSPSHMSLDLKLNLPSQSRRTQVDDNWTKLGFRLTNPDQETKSSNDLKPTTLSFETDYQEMVAVVCTRCHMLVMLCKSSPSCPNCKFMYPIDQFKQRFRLSCHNKD